MVFEYSEKEMAWLSRRDARMGRLIGRVGKLCRELQPDLFRSLAFNIVGQQISMAAQKTVWGRLENLLGKVTPPALAEADPQTLRQLGPVSYTHLDVYKRQALTDKAEGLFQPDGGEIVLFFVAQFSAQIHLTVRDFSAHGA